MREVLFRAKHKHSGGFVYGNLFIPDKPDTPTQICIGTNVIRITYDVIPETVGQFTGFVDKNGKKLFEGDIVKEENCIYTVSFEKDCWVILAKSEFWDFLQTNAKDLEVIGNIHDNPELLEVHNGN